MLIVGILKRMQVTYLSNISVAMKMAPLLRVMQIAPVSLKPLIFCQTMSGKNAIFSQGTLHKLYSLFSILL